jgi:4-hydroxy-2-oxoheptanedioate aldolase
LPENKVIARWSAGELAVAAWMTTHSLLVAQVLAATGPDAVIVEMQHGSATLGDIVALVACIEVRGAEPFVRVPAIDAGLIGSLLDAGVTGIIAPLVETRAQAQALVDAMLYPPRGGRSYGPRIAALRHGAPYTSIANDSLVALAMIETTAGLAAVDEILSVDGLSGLFVGPSDLAFSLGYPPPSPERPPEVGSAIEHIRSKVSKIGKRAGIFCPSQAAGAAALSSGFDLITTVPDLALVEAGTKAGLAALRTQIGG